MTDDLRRIETALLAHWTRNPEAADTLEGIAQCWLSSAAPAEIAVVLDRLLRRGTIIAVSTPRNGHVIYKRVR